MVSEALQNAIDSLKINDVYIEELVSVTQDGYEPKYDLNVEDLFIQFKHVVRQSSVAEVGEGIKILKVCVDLGVRWVVEDKDDAEEKAKIEANFVAEYIIEDDLEDNSINEFSLKNASYHIWPYWRELVASMSERMRLPRVTLPTVQFAANNLASDKKSEA
jgi:preprotein translocase subunit SecB